MQPAITNENRKTIQAAAMFRVAGILISACLILSLLLPAKAEAAGLKGMVGVNTAKLYLRQSARNSARVVTTVYKGTILKVLSDKGIWCNVATSGGKTGWCQSRYLVSASGSSAFKPGNAAMLDWPSEYINLAVPFTWQRCMQDMNEIAAAYGARVETIGASVMGNPIKAIVFGNPEADTRIFVQATIHARESLSSLVALRHAESMLKAASLGASYKGVSVSKLLETVEVWVVPVSNPDGMRLTAEGLAAVPASMPELKTSLKAMNGGRTDFSRWKANAHGVDLNRNFDAHWKIDPYYMKPGPYNYPGPAAFTEPESIALKDLSEAKNFDLSISYHCSGELLYWYNPMGGQNDMNRHIADQLHALNGYTVLAPSAQAPNGGYRDWFMEKFMKPGFTLEIGSGYTPLPQSQFNVCWQDNRSILFELVWTVAPKTIGSAAGS